jgi:hypothetical protein
LSLSWPSLLLLSAAEDRRSLKRALDIFQVARQATDLLVEPADVPICACERRTNVVETSPQVPFPKSERHDLDLVTWVGP